MENFFYKTLLILFWGTVLLPTQGVGQSRAPYIIGLSSQHASLVEHSPKMRHLLGSFPQGVELNLQRQTTGHKTWHQNYLFPRVGISVVWLDYGNPVLGQSLAISPYISKPFMRRPSSSLYLRMGSGLAYFTNCFDPQENPQNNVISSSLNFVMQARLEYERKLAEHIWLMTGLGLNHYSNGATRKPNLGLNLPTFSLGLTYRNQPHFRPVPVVQEAFSRHYFLDVNSSLGLKRLIIGAQESYWAQSATIAVGRAINRKSNLILGLEGFYDRSLYRAQQDDWRLDRNQPFPDVRRVGVVGGHELVIGNFIFQTHLGIYVYRPYKYNSFYYQRLGLKYRFTRHLFGALGLKVHGGRADVVECHLGLRLFDKK